MNYSQSKWPEELAKCEIEFDAKIGVASNLKLKLGILIVTELRSVRYLEFDIHS